MSKRQLEFAGQWLEKAEHDLFAVDAMVNLEESPADIIAFHAQQAIEKSLKGLLTVNSVKFQRTHDLGELMDLAIPFLPDLASRRDKCAILTHFAVDVRYPDAVDEPSKSDVLQARDDAWEIFRIVNGEIRKRAFETPDV